MFRAAFSPLRLLPFAALVTARVFAVDVSVSIQDANGAPVADAVVSLTPLDAPAAVTPPESPVEITQLNKEFVPHVTAIVAGATVKFTNQDRVQHQIYSLSDAKAFDVPLHRKGKESTVVFDQPGVVALGCNVHDWMSAYVVVLSTPWFGKTAETGTATLGGMQAGRYRVQVWHARLEKPETREIRLPGDARLALTLTLKPEQRIRRGPSATGGGYN